MNRLHLFFLILCCGICTTSATFKTLDDFTSYADKTPEDPDIDNADWQQPDFSTFYSSHYITEQSSFWDIFNRKKNRFDLKQFKDTLVKITADRKKKHLEGEFVQKIKTDDRTHILIFGDLQAAFHSLTRDLNESVKKDFITNELTLKKDTYIVFNGNLLDRAAYNLETFMLVLLLMKKNPDNVIYIRGKNELFEDKNTSGLYNQLKIIAGNNANHLFELTEQFLSTLPCVLYALGDKEGALEITGSVCDFDEKKLKDFLSPDNKIDIAHLKELSEPKTLESPLVKIGAIIAPYDNLRTSGLRRYAGSPVTWRVFSSPTSAHRRLYGFTFDAFVLVETAVHFHDWLITLYARDIQAGSDFILAGTYNLSTGIFISGTQINFFDNEEIKAFGKKIEEKKKILAKLKETCKKESKEKIAQPVAEAHQTLVLGTSFDLSRASKKITLEAKNVISAVFEEENKKDTNITYRNIFADDQYKPEEARKNYSNMINNLKVDMIFAPRGTATTSEILDYIRQGRIALFFPFKTETSIFRTSELKNSISLTTSYYEQSKALIDLLLKEYQPKKIALFYQNDGFGKDGLHGAKDELEKHHFTQIIELPYERNQVDFSSQARIINKEDPDAIGFFGLTVSATTLIKNLGPQNWDKKILFGISDLSDEDFLNFVTDKGIKFLYTSTLPDWKNTDIPIVKDFHTFARSHGIKPDPFSFEAYVIAHVFLYLVKHAKTPITKESLLHAAEQIENVDFEGLKLNFNPETRVLLNTIWLAKNDNSPWIQIDLYKGEKKTKEEKPTTKEEPKKKEEEEKAKEEKKESEKEKEEPENQVKALQNKMLVLGHTSDSSKGLKLMTDSLKGGMDLAIKEINAQGGVNDIQLKIIYLDDEYTPDIARKNMQTFMQDYHTDLFIASVGTPTLEAYIDLVQSDKIALFFPFTGSSVYRKPEFKNLLHYAPSYETSTGVATMYILKHFISKRWALLYQNDLFGIPVMNAMKKIFEKQNIKDVLEIPFERNNVNFVQQVKDIVSYNPDVIGFYGPAISAQGFIRVTETNLIANKILYGLSWLAGDKIQNLLKEKGLKMIIPCVLPDPKTSEIPLAQKFRKGATPAGVPLDVIAFEGYLDIYLFVHLLKQVKGTITIEKLMKAGESIKNYDFEGLNLNYNPSERILGHDVWLDLGTGKEWIHVDLEKTLEDKT